MLAFTIQVLTLLNENECFLIFFLAVPPYVPNIQREDDTSNFDDFETEMSGPRIEDFMEQKKGFLGKDLPFIGFTFTKQLTIEASSET